MTSTPEPPTGRPPRSAARGVWLVLGFALVGMGIVGAILPLVPTTIFLILAAGCFARSSPRLEHWLLNHRQFGPGLRAWRSERAISSRAKISACCGMTLGYLLFWLGARPDLGAGLVVATVMAACAAYVVTRPSPRV